MAKTIEYLEQRCAINELVLQALGDAILAHFPALQPQLHRIGEAWDRAIDKLDADIPDAPNTSMCGGSPRDVALNERRAAK
jgi:hypothetical protein